jgi:cell wall-associated NlpC family hydrolase
VEPPVDDTHSVQFRSLIAGLSVVAALVAAPAASARSWADSAITRVVNAGILPGETTASYDPQRALDHGTLAMLVWGAVPSSFGTLNVPTTDRPVTIAELDATFVAALRLAPAARTVQNRLAALGYAPRSDAGTEEVARQLGLRFNHPAGQDRLERSDTEVATRADAAWTTAKVLNGVPTDYARMVVAKFARLPRTTGQRHAALARAVRQIGMPYVWGGTTEGRQPQGHGGFDCSGLVWRVMILDRAAPKGMLRKVGGRTTYEMARTTKRSRRLSRARMRPGDIILYGPNGRHTRWASVDHTGINMGGGLMIHSSSQGVTIKEWDSGWHAQAFVFGKSVLPR